MSTSSYSNQSFVFVLYVDVVLDSAGMGLHLPGRA